METHHFYRHLRCLRPQAVKFHDIGNGKIQRRRNECNSDQGDLAQLFCIITGLIVFPCPYADADYRYDRQVDGDSGEDVPVRKGIGHRIRRDSRRSMVETALTTRIFPSWNMLFSIPFGTAM